MEWTSPEGLMVSAFFLAIAISAVLFILKISKDFYDPKGGGHR